MPVRLRSTGSPRAPRLALGALLAAAALPAIACQRRVETVRLAPSTPSPAAAAPEPARADAAGYDFTPAEKTAIDQFLRANPTLRAAEDRDHRRSAEEDGVGSLYGLYHPYFVRGDGNDDGVLDFVMAFVRRDSDRDSPWFSVVLFSGRREGGFSPGVFLERDISLADGDVSLERDAIVVTPDVDDELTRRYRWDPARQRHVFVRDDASEEPASPPPSQI